MRNRLHIVAFFLLWLCALVPFHASAQVTITQQPLSANVLPGAVLSLSVQATGTGPLFYQWRLNGVNIPGANSSLFTIASFLPINSGDYSVVVADVLGAVNSEVAQVRSLLLTDLPFTDNLIDANVISGTNGIGRGSNVGATREPGEPDHANQRGKHSVWLTWRPPPPAGVATIDTAGSSFDTLLAVYTGDSFSKLQLVASNDDVNSCEDATEGFHTSRVSFNAQPGKDYHIAVDGLADAADDIVLSWNFVPKDHLKPSVAVGPKVKVGSPGDQVRLSASVQSDNGVTEQWNLNCQPIVGATQTNLLVDNLQRSKVGNYVVRVRHTQSAEETLSDPTSLQINITDGRLVEMAALDKFPETADNARSGLAVAGRLQKATLGSSPIRKQSGGPARGYRGTQIFSTVGSTKDPGEPNHCGEPGGASEWYAYQPPANGRLVIDTEGGDLDTVLAIYSGPGSDFQSLVPVACDNNSGSNGKTSKVIFQATKDTVYYIAVDGVRGAVGTVVLNYVLNLPNTPPTISSIAPQRTDEDTPLAGVAFTVNDAQTDSTNLVVTCSSSNPVLVPHGNIAISGSGSNRTMAITPVTNQNGTATITITVADPDGASANSSFLLTVNPVNDPPTISSVANQSTNEDTPTPAIPFSIGDVETAAGSLTVSGLSSNQDLVPDANIVFDGSGSNRTVTIMPATNQFGTAIITITVTDPDRASATNAFLLTDNPVNDLPTISHLADQVTAENTPTTAFPFTIGDVETPAANLRLGGGSSNTNLVPNENIVFGGVGPDRTVTVTPAGSQSGTAVITVTVTDTDGGVASEAFVLTVNSAQPLQFESSPMLTNGAFRVRLTGSILQYTIIEVSSDLSGWLPVFTNSEQTNMVEWIDTSVTNNEFRFYRAVR